MLQNSGQFFDISWTSHKICLVVKKVYHFSLEWFTDLPKYNAKDSNDSLKKNLQVTQIYCLYWTKIAVLMKKNSASFKLRFAGRWFFTANCEKSHPGLNQLDCWHDRQRTPLQDGDHSGNGPRLVPGFLSQCTGMFPERFRRMSVPVGSREICLTWTEHPRCGTLSCWIPGIVS